MQTIPDKNMSFAQTYIFASTVRNKLTKQASNPNSSLRVLVTQANMLDNVMDHLAEETDKRAKKRVSASVDDLKHVSFELPVKKKQQDTVTTNITEYEIGFESESDSDSDSYSDDSDSEDESDSDYYYSDSDEEEEAERPQISIAKVQSFKQLPSIDLSSHSIIEELDEEEGEVEDDIEVPELSRSLSLTDDENSSLSDDENEDLNQSNYTYLPSDGATSYEDKKLYIKNEASKELLKSNSPSFTSHNENHNNTFTIQNTIQNIF